jgi:hypothetical protein
MVVALLIQLLLWVCVTFVKATHTGVNHLFAQGLCVVCRYDLAGLGEVPTCPECGRFYAEPPQETVTRYRFRRRAAAGAVTVLPLSALLMTVGAQIVQAAYSAPPLLLGFSSQRVAKIAASDAENSAFPAVTWALIASAPLWLTRKRARHMEWRLIKAWGWWMAGVCALSVLHSRLLWS